MAAAKTALFDPQRNTLYREDYRPLDYKIPKADFLIDLDLEKTIVRSNLHVVRNDGNTQGGPLVLDGEKLKLLSLRIKDDNGWHELDRSEFIVTDKNLIIKNPPKFAFDLEVAVEINPSENTDLSGLYASNGMICSQCEAQGFRRISYFLDRPDNLTKFNVTMTADKEKFPVLLSNGNGTPSITQDLGDGRHSITWRDPWPKPSYLFAAVGGDFKILEDKFTTMSGKEVDLRIYVQPGYEDKISWAMQSLKRSMKWDEDRYGREYDLNCFHIVATDSFNMGAMENKGLNIFNVSCLVGDPATSMDSDLIWIEAIIAHEYFHNWTGNRVTLSNWFDLTLKEGLTVLRDRQFTEDMHSEGIKRIQDALALRTRQFAEDASPSSHPIRPDMVEEFNNIYSGTVYQKGSHVLGMLHTMMGEPTWRRAMDEYFKRHDGQAVTCDDFLNVMEDVSGLDLKQFRKWYSQSGTPELSYSGEYDAANKTYKLTLSQETKPTPDQAFKEPLPMPIAVGLIGESGKDVPLLTKEGLNMGTVILILNEASQTFVFENVPVPVVPSVLREFSAPVKVVTEPSMDELMFRMAHDSDSYNRYEATERIMVTELSRLIADYEAGKTLALNPAFVTAYETSLSNAKDGDLAFNAMTLRLPAEDIVTQGLGVINPEAVEAAFKFMRDDLAGRFKDEFMDLHQSLIAPVGEVYAVVPEQVGRRSLSNACLPFILSRPQNDNFADMKYAAANNMTEEYGVISAAVFYGDAANAKELLSRFYDTHKDNTNLMDDWLSLQAALKVEKPYEHLQQVMENPVFDKKVPNKIRALIGSFVNNNQTVYHAKDGSGYKFMADLIIEMNDVNTEVAAGFSRLAFSKFKKYSPDRQALMVEQMERIMAVPTLCAGVKDIIGKALDTAKPAPVASAPNASKDFGAKA